MPLCTPGDPAWVVTWARPSRLLAADGVTLKDINHAAQTLQNLAQNGDRMQMFMLCAGNETRLELGTYTGTTRAIFDLYVNGVLDSAGYDDYAAASASAYRHIVLTQPIRAGKNIIELRVNGRNVASTAYYLFVYGASLQ